MGFFFALCKTFARKLLIIYESQYFLSMEVIMNEYNAVRIVKIVGYTVMAGSFALAVTFMAMMY